MRALERPTAGELASWVDGALSDLKELKDDTLLDEGHARVFASRLRDVATWLDPQGVGRPTPDTPSQPTVVVRRPLQLLGSPREKADPADFAPQAAAPLSPPRVDAMVDAGPSPPAARAIEESRRAIEG